MDGLKELLNKYSVEDILNEINKEYDYELEHYFLDHKLGIILPMYVYQLQMKGIDTTNLENVMMELGDDLIKRAIL